MRRWVTAGERSSALNAVPHQPPTPQDHGCARSCQPPRTTRRTSEEPQSVKSQRIILHKGLEFDLDYLMVLFRSFDLKPPGLTR